MSTGRTLPPLPTPCRVTVVIPCRNEEEHIGALLDGLAASDHPLEYLEVLVVDGMSDDGTRTIVEDRARRHPFIRLVDNPQRTTPHALNIGLRTGRYDVGIILGAHAETPPDFVPRNVAALRNDLAVGCAGGIIENVGTTPAARAIASAMAHPFGVGGAHFRTGRKSGYVDTVAFGAYRREVVDELGGFDEDLVRNQDDEYNYRVTRAGHRILLDPSIRSKYYVRAGFDKLYRQYAQYGLWKVYVNRKLGTITTLRQVVPAIWMAFLIGGLPLAIWSKWLTWPYLAGVVLYLVAAIVAAVRAASHVGEIPHVFRAFLTLHAGYGIGYLQGLFRFALLRRSPAGKDMHLTRGTSGADALREDGTTIPRWVQLSLAAWALALPLLPQAVPVLSVLAWVALLIGARKADGMRSFPSITSPLSWTFLLAVLHLIGLLWTTNFDYAFLDLGIKASLLAVPLVAWAIPEGARRGGERALMAFVVGNGLASAICIGAGVWRLFRKKLAGLPDILPWNEVIGSDFSLFLHPSYFALYLCFALALLFFTPVRAMAGRWMWPLVALLVLGIVLSASKVGWALLPLLLVAAMVSPAMRREDRRLLVRGGLVFAVLIAGLFALSPFMREKVEQVVTVSHEHVRPDATGSSEVRVLVWDAAGELFRENWRWGTGTGDVKDALIQRYERKGYVHAVEMRLNAHSQFMQFAVAFGLLGVLLLMALIVVPLRAALGRRDAAMIAFLVLLAVNWSVESMLEVQAGVVFLAWGALMLHLRTATSFKP